MKTVLSAISSFQVSRRDDLSLERDKCLAAKVIGRTKLKTLTIFSDVFPENENSKFLLPVMRGFRRIIVLKANQGAVF